METEEINKDNEISAGKGKSSAGQHKNSIGNSVMSYLRGDFLIAPFYRRQAKLLLLIVVLFILNISNRYSGQKEQLELNALKDTLVHVRYSALVRLSELSSENRQSYIENCLKKKNSDVKISDHAPFVIKK